MNPFGKHLLNVYLSALQIVMNISSALVRYFSLKELTDPLSAEYNAIFHSSLFPFSSSLFCFLLARNHPQATEIEHDSVPSFWRPRWLFYMPVLSRAGAATSIISGATKRLLSRQQNHF